MFRDRRPDLYKVLLTLDGNKPSSWACHSYQLKQVCRQEAQYDNSWCDLLFHATCNMKCYAFFLLNFGPKTDLKYVSRVPRARALQVVFLPVLVVCSLNRCWFSCVIFFTSLFLSSSCLGFGSFASSFHFFLTMEVCIFHKSWCLLVVSHVGDMEGVHKSWCQLLVSMIR